MMRPDRPPGRDAEGGPRTVALTPGNRLHALTSPPPSAEVVPSLSRRADKGRAAARPGRVLGLSDERDQWLGAGARRLAGAGTRPRSAMPSAASLLRVCPAAGARPPRPRSGAIRRTAGSTSPTPGRATIRGGSMADLGWPGQLRCDGNLDDCSVAEALDLAHAKLTRYVVFPCPEAADAAALYAAATHAVPGLEFAARLVVKSPVKRCGKSRLLDVLGPARPQAAADLRHQRRRAGPVDRPRRPADAACWTRPTPRSGRSRATRKPSTCAASSTPGSAATGPTGAGT